jgi:uncharacterized membrane protein
MEYCTKCGAKLTNSEEFCTKCGKAIKTQNKKTKSIEDQIDEFAEDIGKKAEDFGKKIEKKADKIGKKIEKKTDDVGDHVNQWYNNTFKFAGPLVGAFIGLIIMWIIIYIIQFSGEDIHILTSFSNALLTYPYLLIVFASMLISGYNTYFNRKFKQQYLWIYPFISAVSFIIGAWVAAKIMIYIHDNDTAPIIGAIGSFIDTYLIGIFILALIIGYAAQIGYNYYTTEKNTK